MSWSVNAKGKPTEVAESLEKMFEGMSPNPEPEESIKQKIRGLIKDIAAANTYTGITLTISAYGSQGGTPPTNVHNSSMLKVDVAFE